MNFCGKSFLIVGATGAIGNELACSLHDAGAELYLSGRDKDKLGALVDSSITVKAEGDLTLEEDRLRLAESIKPVDGVAFASGIAPIAPIRYTKEANIHSCLSVNTVMPVMVVKELLKRKKIKAGASLVFVSSIAAKKGTAGYAAYAGSKAALEASARCLASELAPKAIRVNCVAPGMVESEMANAFIDKMSDAIADEHMKNYPLGIGRPPDVAGAIAFLLSDAAGWITGITLTVDGGFSIT